MPDKKEILVTGTMAYDLMLDYEGSFLHTVRQADVLSVSFNVEKFTRHHGGTGANIAWNLRLLQQKPLLVANIGPDGKEYLEKLEEQGVDTRYIQLLEKEVTATGIACTDNKQHQIWFFARGADTHGKWPADELPVDDIAWSIISPRHTPSMMEALEWSTKNNIPAIFDPGQEILHFDEEDLDRCVKNCVGIIANAYEWEVLSKHISVRKKDLLKELQFIITTHGPDGLIIETKDGKEEITRCDCNEFKNPTGAGDAFRAGFLAGLMSDWSLRDAGRLGAAMGSCAVEHVGTLIPTIELDNLWERAKTAYGEDLPDQSTLHTH